MAGGYIKDYRQELESDIWAMPPMYHRVWQYLKYKANHTENEIPMTDGTKFKIQPGQHLTSIRNISKGVGWYEGRTWKEPNPRTIMKVIDWLKANNMVLVDNGRGNRQYTMITLVNWEVYQQKEGEGVTADTPPYTTPHTTESKHLVQHPIQQTVHINKNDIRMIKNEKNEKNDKKNIYSDYISMTEKEYNTLLSLHGLEKVTKMIEVLDNYKGANGKEYKSDYRAILSWVVEKVYKELNQNQPPKAVNKNNSFGNYSNQRKYDPEELRKKLLGRELSEEEGETNGSSSEQEKSKDR